MRFRILLLLTAFLAASACASGPDLEASAPPPTTVPVTTAVPTTAPPPTTAPTTAAVPAATGTPRTAIRPAGATSSTVGPGSVATPPTTARPATPAAAAGTLHFTANEDGAYGQAAALGYNVHDTGTDAGTIDSLPDGGRALVWLGEKCPSGLRSTFTSAVDLLGHDAHVLGYYLTDEPDPGACPQGPANVAAESDYIHAHGPGQKSFVVIDDTPGAWAAYAPAHSHVDLVGLDPYPCRVDTGSCNYSLIDTAVHGAEAGGIPDSMLVPTFQDFGGAQSWTMPTPAELTTILARWATFLPHPFMDYSYSWGCQNSSLSACLANQPGAQQVMAAHNAG